MNVAQLVLCDRLERFSVAKAIKFTSNDSFSKFASTCNAVIHKLETLYRNDAQQQVEAFKQNAMADYKELWELRDQRQYLSDANQFLKDEFNNILTLLTDPETRSKIFSIADALIGGKSVITSGGGASSDSDFRWDGRKLKEEKLINRESAFRETSATFEERFPSIIIVTG